MSRAQANGLLLLAALLWGAGNVAQKTVLEDIGPLTAVGVRCLIASLVMLPFMLRSPGFKSGFGPGSWTAAALVIFTFAVAVTLCQFAFGLTSVTNAGFLVNTCTVLTPIAAWILLRHRPATLVWPAAFMALSGAYLTSGGALSAPGIGDALSLGSALFYSLWMIYLGVFVQRFGNACLLTLVQFAVTGFACLAIGIILEPISLAGLRGALPELLMLGTVSTGCGYLLQAVAQRHTTANEASVIVSAEALFGAIFAFILLGEMLTPQGVIGACLIFGGVFAVQINLSPRRGPFQNKREKEESMKGYEL